MMRVTYLYLLWTLWLGTLPVQAAQLDLPTNARMTVERASPLAQYAAPTAPYGEDGLPALRFEGRITQQAWRIEGQALTTLQMLEPLRRQLTEAEFQTLLECEAALCGGFDFRFATDVLPSPNMYVDIRDYFFVTAIRGTRDAPQEVITLLVSRSGTAGYVQITHGSQGAGLEIGRSQGQRTASQARPLVASDLGRELESAGHVILSDLSFAPGSSELSAGPYSSLGALAAFLQANPGARIALVGHTDSQGDLDRNIALSRRRAASVMQRLIQAHNVPEEQLRAEGMGYLSPVASNLVPEGREANRRVEAILLRIE